MDFSQIVLSHKEMRILKHALQANILSKDCERLIRLNLVEQILHQNSPGAMPILTGWCHINDNGISYLLYRKDLNRTRYTIPIAVSVITTAIINVGVYLVPRLWLMLQKLI